MVKRAEDPVSDEPQEHVAEQPAPAIGATAAVLTREAANNEINGTLGTQEPYQLAQPKSQLQSEHIDTDDVAPRQQLSSCCGTPLRGDAAVGHYTKKSKGSAALYEVWSQYH